MTPDEIEAHRVRIKEQDEFVRPDLNAGKEPEGIDAGFQALGQCSRTPLGYATKGLRGIVWELLGEMADRLGYSPAELSGYEYGRSPWPNDIVGRLQDEYSLPNEIVNALYRAKDAKNIGALLTRTEPKP